MTTRHVIIYEGPQRTLTDRGTLSAVTGRPVPTIRKWCPVAERRNGRALYDLDQAVHTLSTVPTRRRGRDDLPY